ncbi:MAG: phage holin family protein [Hydrogenophaga sp.]|jgi:ABC-type protease/lipase transport system fused ATPase/permease subunit|nr:phage holin family protein [Hydrogenophaga sp.]
MTTPTPADAAPSPPAQESLLQTLKGLWQELPGLVSDRVELLSLELNRAGLALAQIAALVVAAAILGVTAWLALWGMVVALLVMAGLHWLVALGLALVANLLAAWWAVSRARSLLPKLKLPATRRHMMLSPSTKPPPVPPVPTPRHEPTDSTTATAPGR